MQCISSNLFYKCRRNEHMSFCDSSCLILKTDESKHWIEENYSFSIFKMSDSGKYKLSNKVKLPQKCT